MSERHRKPHCALIHFCILFAVIMVIEVLRLIFGNFRVCDLFVGWNPITHSSAVCSFVI